MIHWVPWYPHFFFSLSLSVSRTASHHVAKASCLNLPRERREFYSVLEVEPRISYQKARHQLNFSLSPFPFFLFLLSFSFPPSFPCPIFLFRDIEYRLWGQSPSSLILTPSFTSCVILGMLLCLSEPTSQHRRKSCC